MFPLLPPESKYVDVEKCISPNQAATPTIYAIYFWFMYPAQAEKIPITFKLVTDATDEIVPKIP